MPRSAPPRKRGRFRPQALGYLLTPNQVTDLAMVPHMALEKLRLGLFADIDWMNYGTFANAIQLLAQEAGRNDVIEHGTATAMVLHSMRQRAERIKKWGCSGEELTALRQSINPMDDFLRTRTTAQVKRALLRLDRALVRMKNEGVGMLEEAA